MTIDSITIEGYKYVGYFTENQIPSQNESVVHVKYLDENQTEIHRPQLIQGSVARSMMHLLNNLNNDRRIHINFFSLIS